MADGTRRPSFELTRSPSNAEIDTSAPFENVKAARSMFETAGEKSKIPLPARSGSTKSGDWLSKQQGFVSPRSRGNSFEKPRANTVSSPDTATSEYRGYLSPAPSQKEEKLEAELRTAQAQLEDAQRRAGELLGASVESDKKRASLERILAEYQATIEQLEEKLAQEQAAYKRTKESTEAQLRELRTALERSEAEHKDKANQVAAALTAMQTTNDAHDATQDHLTATRDELTTTKALAQKHEEALRATQAALAVAEKRAADALASLQLARQAEEQAKREAGAAAEMERRTKADLAAALSELELARKANATLESRLAAASMELDLAKHAEELAKKRVAKEQVARAKETAESTSAPVESRSSVSTAHEETLSRAQAQLAEAEELGDKRVAAVTAQLDAAKRAEEETKAKLDSLLAEVATTKAAESSTKEKLQAALIETEHAKKALQAESDKAHDAGVNIAIAQAKEKEALEKLATVQQEKENLEAELSEVTKRSVAAPTVSTAQNGSQPARIADEAPEITNGQQPADEAPGITNGQQAGRSEISEEVAHSSKPSAKANLHQDTSEKKSQPACCVLL